MFEFRKADRLSIDERGPDDLEHDRDFGRFRGIEVRDPFDTA